MSANYLLKTEPSEYSFADLQRDKETVWDGVHNPVALRNLSQMTPGTRLIIYETGDHKPPVGRPAALSDNSPNTKTPAVKLKAGKPLTKLVSLAQIKSSKVFADSPLVRQGRLSVVPLTEAQYKFLAGD